MKVVERSLSLICLILLVLIMFSISRVESFEVEKKIKRAEDFHQTCLEIKKYGIKNAYKISCTPNYHHFNSSAYKKYYSHSNTLESSSKIRIASFNLLHPGSLRNAFKNYHLLAKMMNKWDVIAAVELLPVLGRDRHKNHLAVKYMLKNKDYPGDLYRLPGYVKLLNHLQKFDPSWSLILSPKGEAASEQNIHEYLGFFYRSSRVKPIENEHCQQYRSLSSSLKNFSCFPALGRSFLDRDYKRVFSRRPFIASFQSGDFDFTFMTGHMVYRSPSDLKKMKKILLPTFGVNHYHDVGVGVSKENYQRWAEVKVILKLIKKLRENYKEQDIIFAGDMNLNAKNKFFPVLLREFPGEKVYINSNTTISQLKYYADGRPTNGTANNYDHFIFNKKNTEECLDSKKKSSARVFSYYSGMIKSFVEKSYIVRDESNKWYDEIFEYEQSFHLKGHKNGNFEKNYVMRPKANNLVEKALKAYKQRLLQLKTVKNNKIVLDDYKISEKTAQFKKRVFLDQLSNKSYYKVYQELLSDHFPIYMSCYIGKDDD